MAGRLPIRFALGLLLATAALSLASSKLQAQQPAGPHIDPAAPQGAKPEATASLSGDVSDSHDGLVPEATISAVRKGTDEIFQATADGAGHFTLTGLQAGTWTVTVSAIGLEKYEAPAIELKAGERGIVPGIVLVVAAQTADVTVTVTTQQVAEMELHDEEKQRVLGVFPNFYTSYVWNAAPLSAMQKFKLSIRSQTDPVSFITPAIVAGIEQERGTYAGFGDGFSGYASRYGAAYGDAFIGRVIGGGLLPALFRQDPRYFYQGTGTVKSRAWHAIESSVLCRGDSGHTEFNISHILGNFAAGYLSKVYHPGSNTSISLAVDNTLIGIGGTAVVDLVREFLVKSVSKGVPLYGKGKPPAETADTAPF